MAETLNMREVTIKEVTDFIKDLITMEIYDPVIVLGKMGMGKTASLKGLAKELGIGYCELRLVNMTETDMLGIPTVSADGTTTYASNDLLPRVDRDGEVGILAIDEITSCSAVMRAAAYQLLDGQRSLGNYKLPEKWLCVGLGNGPDDGGVFNGAEAALFTRCYGFRVSANVDAWKQWAVQNNINPTIIAYLTYDKSKLHVYDPDELDGLCPTPRTWEKLSKLLNAKEKYNEGKPLPTGMVDFLASACVGEREAGAFAGFYKYTEKGSILTPDDILSGRANGKEIKNIEPQVIYITIESLVKQLNDELSKFKNSEPSDECINRVCNALNWVLDTSNIRLDYAITGIRDVVANVSNMPELIMLDDRIDERCPNLLKFACANGVVLK